MASSVQGELFGCAAGRSEQALWLYLNENPNQEVRLTVTRNHVTMASVRFHKDGRTSLRLHEAYLNAPQNVWLSLRRYVRTRRHEYWKEVAAYARRIEPAGFEPRSHRPECARGRVHDLQALLTRNNRELFSNRVRCRIGWGRMPPNRPGGQRSIRFGSWHSASGMIRIHPYLDDHDIPADFVRYIIYHEMLHVVVPPESRGGRRYDHPAAFRALERGYPGYDQMQQLCASIANRLLRRS